MAQLFDLNIDEWYNAEYKIMYFGEVKGMVAKKYSSRLMSLVLVMLMIIEMLPLSLIQANAGGQAYKPTPVSLASGEVTDAAHLAKLESGEWLKSPYLFENWMKSGFSTDSKGWTGIPSGWQTDIIEEFVELGITYGVKDGDKYYMPGVNNITGTDALAATLMFYYPTTSNGYTAYRSASGSGVAKRKNTYSNAASYYNSAFSISSSYQTSIRSISGKRAIKRYDAFLMIATAIEGKSGGQHSLDNYSGNKLGFYRGNNRKINYYDDVVGNWWKNDSSGTRAIEGMSEKYVKAINMLIDIADLKGRGTGVGSSDQRCDAEGDCSYCEYYSLLRSIETGVDAEPPVLSYVKAAIDAPNKTVTKNYKEFVDDGYVAVSIRPDTSDSESNLDATFTYHIEDDCGNEDDDVENNATSYKAPASKFTYYNGTELTVDGKKYVPADGLVKWKIGYDASIAIEDEEGEKDKAKDSGIITIELTNEDPDANVNVYTPSLPTKYQKLYIYVGKDVTMDDLCSDYEQAIEKIEYTIKYNGKIVGHSVDFVPDKVDSDYFATLTGDPADKSHIVNFKKAGTYELTVKVTDEMGATDTYTRNLNVSPMPSPPTAKIDGMPQTYSKRNTTFTDASTDPNNDIVEWVWGDVEYFNAVLDENGDETDEGVWVKATPGVDYTGTLKNGTLPSSGAKPDVSGTLQFNKYGKFRLNLTVTDATGLTDSTKYVCEVLEDIPIVIVNPDPVIPEYNVEYIVTFINTDGTKKEVTVKAGDKVPAEQVPGIVDMPGLVEHGWTRDGKSMEEPTEVVVNGNITFVVLTTPEDENKSVCTVTFINTDGSKEYVKVAKGGKVPAASVPEIIDLPNMREDGWTAGEGIVNPTEPVIDRDMVFWVEKTPLADKTHTVTFVNTDGTTTTITVPDGEKIPVDKIPGIIDLPEYTENGWTKDGDKLTNPKDEVVTKDLVFWVDKDPVTPIKTHTVTFINTDGTMKQIQVIEGQKVPSNKVPDIKDLPKIIENGWVTEDVPGLVNPSKIVVNKDLVFWVDTEPEPAEKETCKVTFTNTDGTVTTVLVPKGETTPSDKVPSIVDVPGLIENGWTQNGNTMEDPTKVVVNHDLHFWVDTEPEKPKDTHTVTFINSDGEKVTIEVENGKTIDPGVIPSIKDLPDYTESGWRTDGKPDDVDPSKIVVDKDLVFWIDTEPIKDTCNVYFTNTDGTVTVVVVPKGDTVPADKVPAIVDEPGLIENGWTQDGNTIKDPTKVVVNHDLHFWVDTDPEKPKDTHTVTFINSDGEKVTIEVENGKTIDPGVIPDIKDLPNTIESGWKTDGTPGNVDPSKIVVDKDLVFWVDTSPEDSDNTCKVYFTNTDGTVTIVIVKKGTTVPSNKVPDIVNDPDLVENGWTRDGSTIEDPTKIVVNEDLHFWVDVAGRPAKEAHTVTFVNTDGTITTILVPHGELIPGVDVPSLVDLPGYTEKGWTENGDDLVDPSTVTVLKDLVFYVIKEKDTDSNPDDYKPHFDTEGRLIVKQNRTGVIDVTQSLSPPNDPINWSQTEWEFISVNGYNLDNVKIPGGKPENKICTFVGTEPGVFQVKVTLHNKYSDNLAQAKPNSQKLNARTHTVTVIVVEDEPPEAELYVNNANPNFHTNPVSIDVTVASSATSPDFDKIGKYKWKIVRDTNNDGKFDDEKTSVAEMEGEKLSTVTFPVTFQSGVVGQFLATLTVQEEPGQATLPEFVGDDKKLTATTSAQFEVNWTPCISYEFQLNGNQWAYVDDVINIPAIVKDENVGTCKVTWTLKKKVGTNYVEVATGLNDLCDVWDFNTLGGDIRITEDGYYVMEATIVDDHGYKETFVSNEIRIYALPVAVIKDDPAYRWDFVIWQYKEARKFCLDGNSSTVDDSTGPALHQIVHDKDEWSITPVSGGALADAVYVLADDGTSRLMSENTSYYGVSNNAFDEQLAIIEPGTYMVSYRVTNEYGKRSEVATQLITIVKDEEPILNEGTPSKFTYLGSAEANRYVTIGPSNITVESTDYDIVGYQNNVIGKYRYDSNNDGSYEDETWVDCDLVIDNVSKQGSYAHISSTATVNQVGMYQFYFAVKEDFGQETLPTIIPESCYISKEFSFDVQVENNRPQGTFNMTNKVYGDVVFVLGQSADSGEIAEKSQNFGNNFGNVEGAQAFVFDVNAIENKFDCEYALHITWPEYSDIDTHVYLYDKNGRQLDHVDYTHKVSSYGVQLNVDDRSGGNSNSQNYVEKNTGGGEWFTINFQSMSNQVTKMVVQVYGYDGSGTTTMTLVNTVEKKITLQQTAYCHDGGWASFGNLVRNGSSNIWDFYDTSGTYYSGSSSKTLAECLTDVSFNIDHHSFVIWAEDRIPKELNPNSPTYNKDYAELVSLLSGQNVHLIILGSDKNEAVMNELLGRLMVEGIFINTGNVDDDMNEAVEFISRVMRQNSSSNAKYVLINEESIYDKYYADYNGHDHWYAGGGTTDTIASSRWWYSHDPSYFCNELGLLDTHEQWIPDEITMFSQTGLYYVSYKVKDNSVPDAYLNDNSTNNPFDEYRHWSTNYDNNEYDVEGNISNKYAEIYVHRRPLAEYSFNASISATNELQGIVVTNDAYDLDHYEVGNPKSREDRGLQMYEWSYQLTNVPNSKKTALFMDAQDGEDWLNRELASIAYNSQSEVVISYRVRDIDGFDTTEFTTWKETLDGTIYKAPKNSYHHTQLEEDLYVGGKLVARKGEYVTTSYEEAISELRAAADKRKSEYEAAVKAYESAKANAEAKEQEAQAAEALRDAKQAEVDAQQTVVNNHNGSLNKEKQKLAALQATLAEKEKALTAANEALATAQTAYDNALANYNSANSQLVKAKADKDALEAQLATLKNELATLQSELAALKAVDTSTMTDEEKTAHESAIAAKEAEITAKQAKITQTETAIAEKETLISTLEGGASSSSTALNAAKAELNSKKAAADAAKAERDAAKKDVDAQTAVVNSSQGSYNQQLAKLNQLKSELADLSAKATTARSVANAAAANAANALTTMNNAKAAWDAAEAAVAAVKPIAQDPGVWVTISKNITIPDGVWSLYNTVRVSGNPLPPVAKFKTDKIYYDLKETVNITDMSYSPNGNNIVRWDWQVTGGPAAIDRRISYSTTGASGTTKVTSVEDMENRITQWVTNLVNSQKLGMTNADNTYKITLNVTDDKSVPLKSERPYSVSIVLVPSNNPPTVNPDPGIGDLSLYKKDGVMIYEYDPYDANEVNPFYTYGTTPQKRGTEYLNWALEIDDPDNHDTYGTANDSNSFILNYLIERFGTKSIKEVTIDDASSDTIVHGPLTITAADAKNNERIAPFITSKDAALNWGTYRITTSVTDIPNNGSAGKTASIVTNPDVIPKHLYVIPRLEVMNPHYEWEGTIDTAEQIPVGDTVTITIDSDEETVGMNIRFPDGLGGENVTAATCTGSTTDPVTGLVTKHWTADMVIPDTLEDDDLIDNKVYTYYCEAWTDYGFDDGTTKTRTKALACQMNVLAIKLYNFKVTDIADPAVDVTDEYVPHLAIDELNDSDLTRLGYSFYFDLMSMGMKNTNDTIRIRPHFYGYNSVTMQYTDELDVYYKNHDGVYALATSDPDGTRPAEDTMEIYSSNTNGHSYGHINEIVLTSKDRTLLGNEQYWAGRYGLPSSAVFVEKDDVLSENTLYKGKVMVMFEIVARKDNVIKYDYIGRGQWQTERDAAIADGDSFAEEKDNLYSVYEGDYGAVIILDGEHTAADNYSSRPVWRSTNR